MTPPPVYHCGDESQHVAHEWELPGGARFFCVGTDAAGAEIARRARFAGLPRWEPPAPIEWGGTLCRRKRCAELSACSIDGEPFCLEHADEEIERACVPPDFARLLPGLDE